MKMIVKLRQEGYRNDNGKVRIVSDREIENNKLIAACAEHCRSCRQWKDRGCIGECMRADFMLITKPEDACVLRKIGKVM